MTAIISQDIVVIYHADCRDGFGAAYAAWKKFGESATYIPRKTQFPPPEGLTGKEIYILDYSYSKETLDELVANNRSVTVIDHHQTAKAAVTSFPNNIFDQLHSGATLAWMYFHPDTPVPKLLLYVEEHDLWKDTLPHSKEIAAIIGEHPLTFAWWDELVGRFEDEKSFAALAEKGAILREYIDKQAAQMAQTAHPVTFEGQTVYALNYPGPYRSLIGNLVAAKHPPMSIIWSHEDGMFRVSLRSVGDFDVANIAQKYGGGGHKNASGFKCKKWEDLPFAINQ